MDHSEVPTKQVVDDYIGWARFRRTHPDRPLSITFCDNNDDGAFKVYRRRKWISVHDYLPSHIHTVGMWVIGGSIHFGQDYADVGIYNAARQQWQACYRKEDGTADDCDVQVSHWMYLDKPQE